MRTLINLFAFLCFTSFSFAQETRSIQLTVTDTITLNVTQIQYEIKLGAQYDYLGLDIGQESQPAADGVISLSTIADRLKKEKYSYASSDETDYKIGDTPSKEKIIVTLKNEKELKSLCELLKTYKGISGKIADVSYEPESKYQKDVYTRLYTKAFNQATMLAGISGTKIGNLMSASDMQNNAGDWMSLYKQMMKKMPMGLFGETSAAGPRKEEVSMTFKFELK